MKPIIGIISRPDKLESGRKVDIVYSSIRTLIVELGGIPLVITPPTNTIYEGNNKGKFDDDAKKDLEPMLSLCDGFIFQGGDEFYTYDLFIVDYAYKHNIPSLGICLGMQLMSCYKNGTLGRFSTNEHHRLKDYVHPINIKEHSKLFSILNTTECFVNSRHHDYVIKTDLDVVATSKDTIEAVEDRDKNFFIGVQWHPEDMIAYDEVMKKLWTVFIKSCRECSYESKRSDFKM